jgi:diadenylate cyclase
VEFLTSFFDAIYAYWNQFIFAVKNISLFDILDILIMAFIVYKAIEFLRDTRAGQLVKGIALLILAFFLATAFNLASLKWLLTRVIDYAIIVIAIIFQPELRRLLEKVGRSNFSFLGKQQVDDEESENVKNCIDAVCKAVNIMSDKKIGALIVFERKTMLGEIINTGTLVNAQASYELICNVFFPKSPLHDGAMIIRDGVICSAGCILPLTSNNNLNSQLGTRHRAAIGMSENSDAIVLVVSEETGNISLARNGVMVRDFNSITLKEELYVGLLTAETKKKNFFMDILNKFKKK